MVNTSRLAMYTGLIVTSTSPLHHSSSVHHSTNPTVANKNLTLHPPQCFAGPLSHHIWDDKPMKSVITVCAHFKYGDIDGFHYSECKLSIRYGYFRPLEWRITRGTDTSDTSIFKSVRVKIANQRHRETHSVCRAWKMRLSDTNSTAIITNEEHKALRGCVAAIFICLHHYKKQSA